MPSQIQFCVILAVFFALIGDACCQEQSYDQLANTAMRTGYSAPPKTAQVPNAKPLKNAKKPIPKHGVIKYDIYRDRRPYPVDPRKPCHICIQRETNSKFAALHSRIYGFQGRPYQEKEPGGCLCGKKKQKFKKPNFNVYWPTFAAGVPEELFPVKSAMKACNYNRFRLVDIYDNLGGWELSGYERRDNGYCGKERERYGCLGESKILESRVRGVGFRVPGQPVERGGISFP